MHLRKERVKKIVLARIEMLTYESVILGFLPQLVSAVNSYHGVHGSNPSKPVVFFFRSSFCNCISCVLNCEDCLCI